MSKLSERPEQAVAGETMPHESAALHVTGHALYTDTLLPAVEEGMRKAGRAAAGYERLLEVKVSYAADVETAIADCRYWAPLALPAEAKQGVDDPIELERLRCVALARVDADDAVEAQAGQ